MTSPYDLYLDSQIELKNLHAALTEKEKECERLREELDIAKSCISDAGLSFQAYKNFHS